MVLCFVALFVFAVLGIFSAKYRALFFEALGCVGRTLTLRPCESKLDERIKATLIAHLLQRSPPAARAVHKHFAALSLVFTILFFGSMIYSAVAVYNYWAYGNCNGPNSSEFCAFDAVLRPGAGAGNLTAVQAGIGPKRGNGSIVMVEFGCFSCPFTRSAQSPLNQFLASRPDVSLEFRAFPIPTHENSFVAAQAAFCADEQGKFWEYHDALFADENHSRENLGQMAARLSLDGTRFDACMASNSTPAGLRVQRDVAAGHAAGIYGTPTFFINGVTLVGPQTPQEFSDALRGIGTSKPEQAASCHAPNASG
ncbi:Thioredoxin [uncultured archaeon]|nr:Thioredoxin [uncultured archaeon]